MAITSKCGECPECTSGKGSYICENIRREYVGMVLQEYERNFHDDSDFFAIVWDAETESLDHVEYNSTRHGGGKGCTVDATPAVEAKAIAFVEAWLYRQMTLRAECERERPKVGKTVRSLTTRGKNKGSVGTIVALEPAQYGYNRYESSDHPCNIVCKVQIWGELDPSGSGDIHYYEGAGHPKVRLGYIPHERVEVLTHDVPPVDYEELATAARNKAQYWGFRLTPSNDPFYLRWLQLHGQL